MHSLGIDTSLAIIPSSILSDILYFRCNVTSVDFMPMFGPLSVIVREFLKKST